MAPTYHLSFTALDTLIMLDATDLEFHNSVEMLQDQFQYVTHGKLIGLANDLSSNYFLQLSNYREGINQSCWKVHK